MKIAEYKKIGSHKEQRIIHHDAVFDEFNGLETEPAYDEVVEVDVPEMGLVYRDATLQEEAEAQMMLEEMQEPEPTLEEQVADLTDLVMILTEVLSND